MTKRINQPESIFSSPEHERWKNLCKASTLELIRLVVNNSDEMALRCFLETRTIFAENGSGRKLLLFDYLDRLRKKPYRSKTIYIRESDINDCAYDLTLEKYLNLKSEKGPNCRNYFGAFVKIVERKIAHGVYNTQTEEESDAGKVLQRLVRANFHLSRLECIRKIKPTIRYTWKTKSGEITIEYPAYMTAGEIREWLEENIKDVNPMNPNEQKRIQEIIDSNLRPVQKISLDNPKMERSLSSEFDIRFSGWKASIHFMNDLVSSVVERKVKHIEILRPAIRQLGEKRIRDLIFRIFEDLVKDDFHDAKIAKEFGISRATFSRFAGSQWYKDNMKSTTVPDLWCNTATVLVQSDSFLDRVIESGFKDGLERILNTVKPITQKDGIDD